MATGSVSKDTQRVFPSTRSSRCPTATVLPVPNGLLATARAALARGDVLMAYDAAVSAIEADPENLECAFVAALALARAGARRTGTRPQRQSYWPGSISPPTSRSNSARTLPPWWPDSPSRTRWQPKVTIARRCYERLLICTKQLPTGMDASTRASTRPRCVCWPATSRELASLPSRRAVW